MLLSDMGCHIIPLLMITVIFKKKKKYIDVLLILHIIGLVDLVHLVAFSLFMK